MKRTAWTAMLLLTTFGCGSEPAEIEASEDAAVEELAVYRRGTG